MTRRRTEGFTLLELIVVLGIFAMVALVGVQVIRTTVLTDRHLTEVSKASEEIAVGLALLRRDLGSAVGVSFYTLTGASEPPLRIASDGFALSVGGLGGVDNSGPGLGRVIWKYDQRNGRVTRQVWTTLTPGSRQATSPEVAVVSDVTGMTVESFTAAAGWQPGFAPDPRRPNALPQGLRVRLDHQNYDRIETLVALR